MSIRAWRIVQARYADRAFTGEGARLFGGRWNRPGTRMIYTSESLSLATLEILVNLESPDTLDQYLCIPIEFDETLCKALELDALPANWAADPPSPDVQHIGTNWVTARESVALAVPSAVVHREHNFLLNPEHPDFSQVRIGSPAEFELDPRLVGGL